VENGERVVKNIYQKKNKIQVLCEALPLLISCFHFIFCNASVLPFLLTIPLVYDIYCFPQEKESYYCMKISVQFCSLVKVSGFQSCRGKFTYMTWMNSQVQKIGHKWKKKKAQMYYLKADANDFSSNLLNSFGRDLRFLETMAVVIETGKASLNST